MADYRKLSSDESGLLDLELGEIKKKFGSGLENQTLLNLKLSSPKKSSKLELVDYESPKTKQSQTQSFSSDIFLNLESSLSPSLLQRKKPTNPPVPFSMNRSRQGHMKMFLYNEEDSPLFVIGPGWPLPLLIFIVINLFTFFYFYLLWQKLNFTQRILGIFIFFTEMISFIVSCIMNPGIPSKDLWVENYYKNRNNIMKGSSLYRICKDCKLIMKDSEGIEHCDKCGVCIKERKRHSIVIGKCIGEKNEKIFYTFAFSIACLAFYFLVTLFTVIFFPGNNISNNSNNDNTIVENNNNGQVVQNNDNIN